MCAFNNMYMYMYNVMQQQPYNKRVSLLKTVGLYAACSCLELMVKLSTGVINLGDCVHCSARDASKSAVSHSGGTPMTSSVQ